MAAVPLLQESPEKTSTIRSSISRFANFVSSTIIGKDELTVACEKATSISSSSYSPKEKHISFLIDKVDENPQLIEEILLRFSALTEWSENPIVAIKVLSCVHQIMRKVPSCVVQCANSLLVYLTEVRKVWGDRGVTFVDQYSSALCQHVLTARQYFQLFENTFGRSSGLSLGITFFDCDEIVGFMSKLLTYQDRLLSLMRIPQFPSSSSQKSTILARKAACRIILEQTKFTFSILFFLVNHLESLKESESKPDMSVFREQLDSQDRLLRDLERDLS